jgi:hypothetical protein
MRATIRRSTCDLAYWKFHVRGPMMIAAWAAKIEPCQSPRARHVITSPQRAQALPYDPSRQVVRVEVRPDERPGCRLFRSWIVGHRSPPPSGSNNTHSRTLAALHDSHRLDRARRTSHDEPRLRSARRSWLAARAARQRTRVWTSSDPSAACRATRCCRPRKFRSTHHDRSTAGRPTRKDQAPVRTRQWFAGNRYRRRFPILAD